MKNYCWNGILCLLRHSIITLSFFVLLSVLLSPAFSVSVRAPQDLLTCPYDDSDYHTLNDLNVPVLPPSIPARGQQCLTNQRWSLGVGEAALEVRIDGRVVQSLLGRGRLKNVSVFVVNRSWLEFYLVSREGDVWLQHFNIDLARFEPAQLLDRAAILPSSERVDKIFQSTSGQVLAVNAVGQLLWVKQNQRQYNLKAWGLVAREVVHNILGKQYILTDAGRVFAINVWARSPSDVVVPINYDHDRCGPIAALKATATGLYMESNTRTCILWVPAQGAGPALEVTPHGQRVDRFVVSASGDAAVATVEGKIYKITTSAISAIVNLSLLQSFDRAVVQINNMVFDAADEALWRSYWESMQNLRAQVVPRNSRLNVLWNNGVSHVY